MKNKRRIIGIAAAAVLALVGTAALVGYVNSAKDDAVADETLDRSASGLDARTSERSVMFWLLSDRALFLVVGEDLEDHAFRIPYEAIAEMTLDYDDTAEFLPWYVRLAMHPEEIGDVTRLDPGNVPGQPLGSLPPVPVTGEDRRRLARYSASRYSWASH